jgi:translation initiation factor 4G
MVALDDESIDFPQAYKAMAVLIRSIDMPDDEIATLAESIDAYEPVIPAPVKLNEALATVDKDSSS